MQLSLLNQKLAEKKSEEENRNIEHEASAVVDTKFINQTKKWPREFTIFSVEENKN